MDGSEAREIRPHAAVKSYATQIGREFQGIPRRRFQFCGQADRPSILLDNVRRR